jgi:uncharacterized OB-fold protein
MKGAEDKFRSYLAAGEIRLQRCKNCSKYVYYPRDFCNHCHGEQLEWLPVTGKGEIYSLTVTPARKEGDSPANTVIVELDEGVRVLSRVENADPFELGIGMKVKARISAWKEMPVLVFDLEDDHG